MVKQQDSSKPGRATLQMPRSKAKEKLREQIRKGEVLLNQEIKDEAGLNNAHHSMSSWTDYNCELLKRIIDTDEFVEAYRLSNFRPLMVLGGTNSLQERVHSFQSELENYILALNSILDRLDLIPEAPKLKQASFQQQASQPHGTSKKVFIVHGHDEAAKESVARLLEKLDLEPIILHEKPNQGRTIIEKFEDYSDVGFAVVLLTPDDVGAVKEEAGDLKPRARQNVIFELGFFIGKLGRQRVCALYKGDVEILSDFSGVLWTPLDEEGAWRLKLGKEMKAAGLNVDLNKLAQ